MVKTPHFFSALPSCIFEGTRSLYDTDALGRAHQRLFVAEQRGWIKEIAKWYAIVQGGIIPNYIILGIEVMDGCSFKITMKPPRHYLK